MKPTFLLLSLFILAFLDATTQPIIIEDPFLQIDAGQNDPLYTTYTAAMERSRLYGDKGYKMDYYSNCLPVSYESDQSGKMFCLWKVNQVVIRNSGEYHSKPIVKASFSDMAVTNYSPWPGIEAEETFFVYSSKIAMVNLFIRNTGSEKVEIELYPVLYFDKDSLLIRQADGGEYILGHYETRKRLISNLYAKGGYPTHWTDIFTMDVTPYSYGGYTGDMDDFYNTIKTDFYSEDRCDSLNLQDSGYVRFTALHGKFSLEPGSYYNIRFFRGMQDESEDTKSLQDEISTLNNLPIQPYFDRNAALYLNLPRPDFRSPREKMIYLGAMNLARGCMLPPAGETSYNFYVFSREPLWGWGHGHQVLHESLSMLAYAYLDPFSAQESQRVYMEQQGDDGLIAYRHGPRGAQTYPHKDMPTTSAPFYSWINWEVYLAGRDQQFLEDAYVSGTKYLEWLQKNRDTDQDGLYEWGPYGIIENVRDWYNAVFQVSAERYLDVDKEDISDELECLDLSLMIVNEMRHLGYMATELGKKKEAARWEKEADKLSEKINEVMWDEESGFFYSVDKDDHSFMFMTRDLRRQEIIGFLPLWSKSVSPERADILVKTLTDPDKFWRKYGVPTLTADDPWYSPNVDYCCKWNGPVWLLWDYMVFRGLLNYGYDDLANELGGKMLDAVSIQLSKNHNFWESYSPDNEVLNCPPNYIWDAIMGRVIMEMNE
ncbi:MAG: hypothetical protein KKA81_03700 [Bacteroidetes bacterium]|nr:hypothetical protein [Bacteroidota bacterium]